MFLLFLLTGTAWAKENRLRLIYTGHTKGVSTRAGSGKEVELIYHHFGNKAEIKFKKLGSTVFKLGNRYFFREGNLLRYRELKRILAHGKIEVSKILDAHFPYLRSYGAHFFQYPPGCPLDILARMLKQRRLANVFPDLTMERGRLLRLKNRVGDRVLCLEVSHGRKRALTANPLAWENRFGGIMDITLGGQNHNLYLFINAFGQAIRRLPAIEKYRKERKGRLPFDRIWKPQYGSFF